MAHAADFIRRLDDRLAALGLSQTAASKKAKLSPDAIRNIKRAAESSGEISASVKTLTAIATALETSASWLLDGRGPEAIAPGQLAALEDVDLPHQEAGLAHIQLVQASVAGRVAAGVFREVDEFDQSEIERIIVPADPIYPNARVLVFDVEGDSMNDLKPRPILDGDRAICLSYEDISRHVPITDKMVVVVQRSRDGGMTREWSIKQVQLYEDRVEFHPRSTNPKHKPIIIKRDPDADNGVQVEIIALLRRTVTEYPMYL